LASALGNSTSRPRPSQFGRSHLAPRSDLVLPSRRPFAFSSPLAREIRESAKTLAFSWSSGPSGKLSAGSTPAAPFYCLIECASRPSLSSRMASPPPGFQLRFCIVPPVGRTSVPHKTDGYSCPLGARLLPAFPKEQFP